jgi:hypothetical protein
MTIDSNIVIAYLAEDLRVSSFLDACREQGIYLYISTVVASEVLAFEMTPEERKIVKQFLKNNFIIIPFSEDLVDLVAELRMTSRIKLPDAIIAATALHTGSALLTRNVKDFKKVKGLKVMSL